MQAKGEGWWKLWRHPATLKIGSDGLFGGAHWPSTNNKMPSTARRIPDISMPSDER